MSAGSGHGDEIPYPVTTGVYLSLSLHDLSPRLQIELTSSLLFPGQYSHSIYLYIADHGWHQVIERNIQRMAAQARLNLRAGMDRIHAEDAARGLPRRNSYPDAELPLVKQVESAGFDKFGFFVFRTDFSDDERWDRFVDRFYELLDEAEDQQGPETGFQRIKDKELIQIVNDEAMKDKNVRAIAL
jgi:hypothetical protein